MSDFEFQVFINEKSLIFNYKVVLEISFDILYLIRIMVFLNNIIVFNVIVIIDLC